MTKATTCGTSALALVAIFAVGIWYAANVKRNGYDLPVSSIPESMRHFAVMEELPNPGPGDLLPMPDTFIGLQARQVAHCLGRPSYITFNQDMTLAFYSYPISFNQARTFIIDRSGTVRDDLIATKP